MHEKPTQSFAERSNSPDAAAREAKEDLSASSPLLTLQRAFADPLTLKSRDVKQLQRTIGNRAVIRLLSGPVNTQIKPKVGPIGAQAQPSVEAAVQRLPEQAVDQTPAPAQRHIDLQRKVPPPRKTFLAQPRGHIDPQPYSSSPMLQRKPDDPDVTTIDWAGATSATPSPPSAMGGVVFVVVGGVTHVVKPSDQPAAALFGEKMLEDMAGAETTQSKPVATDSAEGQRILALLTRKKTEADGGEDDALKQAWADRHRQASGAKYFLIQKAMIAANQFSKLMKTDPNRILGNTAVLEGIGRTMAVDGLTGNQDRFENLNFDNVFLTADNKIGAIDTDAVLQNYAKSKSESDSNEVWANYGSIRGSEDWATSLTSGGVAILPEGAGMGPSSSDLRTLFERFAGWFDGFKSKFVREQPALEDSVDWAATQASIRKGINDGIAAINTMLSGEGYDEVRGQFSALKERYNEGGEDPNFDWQAFQVKATYLKSRSAPAGNHGAAQLEAAFVAKQPAQWAAEVDALGDVGDIEPIPAPPGKLSLNKSAKQTEFEKIYAELLAAIGEHATRLEQVHARTVQLYADKASGGMATDIAYQMLRPIETLIEQKRLDPVMIIYRKTLSTELKEWDKRDGAHRSTDLDAQISRFSHARTELTKLVNAQVRRERAAIVNRGRSAHSPAAPPPVMPPLADE